MSFFKKIGYSITKIEKYPEMAAEGTKKAIKNIVVLVAILSIVFCASIIYKVNKVVQDATNYIETNIPEFSFKDGFNLSFDEEQQEPIIIENEVTNYTKILIDVRELRDDVVEKYKEEIKGNSSGILILKNKLVLITNVNEQEATYKYEEIAQELGTQNFTKGDALNYLRGSGIAGIYAGVFAILFIYSFLIELIYALWIALLISIVGYLVAFLLKIKLPFKAIFNMASYALTLPIILNIIYMAINIFTVFTISIFQTMYMAIALIYLIAAIFLTRIDFMKQQEELTKIEEVHKEVKKQIEEEKEKKEEENKKEPDDKKEKSKKQKEKKEKNRKGEGEGEPEGSNV